MKLQRHCIKRLSELRYQKYKCMLLFTAKKNLLITTLEPKTQKLEDHQKYAVKMFEVPSILATELSVELVHPNFVTQGRVHILHHRSQHLIQNNQRRQQRNQKRVLQMV